MWSIMATTSAALIWVLAGNELPICGRQGLHLRGRGVRRRLRALHLGPQ